MMRIFLCSSQQDSAFSQSLKNALQHAGVHVWYDVAHHDTDILSPKSRDLIQKCSVFLLVLSPIALTSSWVLHATKWAHSLYLTKPTRILMVVTLTKVSELSQWELLHDFQRIEATPHASDTPHEALYATLFALSLLSPQDAPTFVLPPQQTAVQQILGQSKVLLRQQEYTKALSLLLEAQPLTTDSFQLCYYLGYAYANLHRYQEALNAYEYAAQLDPTSVASLTSQGLALSHLHRFDEALLIYEQALLLQPHSSDVLACKALALHKLKRDEEALQIYEEVVALTPDSPRTWKNMAITLQALGRTQEASAALVQANKVVSPIAG